MPEPFAEVIGDPVGHSLSPAIHRHWLRALGLPGDFRAVRCTPDELDDYLNTRARDPAWRGCSVTMPLKQQAAALVYTGRHAALRSLDEAANLSGAVNCIVRGANGLLGRNTDVDGVAASVDHVVPRGSSAVVIGAGGAAVAAIVALGRRGIVPTIIVRAPASARHILDFNEDIRLVDFQAAPEAIAGADLVINATPLGMENAPFMPPVILESLGSTKQKTIFDMVYRPIRTPFLQAAEATGHRIVDGLTMLIGQARPAFAGFFGTEPPAEDDRLRALLTSPFPAG